MSNSTPIAAVGEFNLAVRQQQLRARAAEIAGRLSLMPEVRLVWLTGSVAKGLVDGSSDLDLHVFTASPLPELSEWRFSPASAPENIHQLPLETIHSGVVLAGDPPALADWMMETGLADALSGAICLYCRPDASVARDEAEHLVSLRSEPKFRLELSHSFARGCAEICSQVEEALDANAVTDAHQILRHAAQELMVANLICRGWIIRGSKKRPEIAKAYNLHESTPEFMSLFFDINGLTNLTPDTADQLCAERHTLRQKVATCLRALSTGLSEEPSKTVAVSEYEQHNLHAENYYSSLLRAGIYLGPVNHIRAFSGFAFIPRTVLQVLGSSFEYPVSAWLSSCDERTKAILDQWSHIADLSSSRTRTLELLNVAKEQALSWNPN